MHHDQAARLVFAAGERNLELPPEILRVVVPEQEIRHGSSVWRNIERFSAAYAGEWAGRDVPHDVTARLVRCDPYRRKSAHHVGRILDVHKVQLEILTRRDVQYFVRILLGNLAEYLQLVSRQSPERNLDPLHAGRIPQGIRTFHRLSRIGDRPRFPTVVALPVVVPLTVDTLSQACLSKDLFFELPVEHETHLPFKDVDVVGQVWRYCILQPLFPVKHVGIRVAGFATESPENKKPTLLLPGSGL